MKPYAHSLLNYMQKNHLESYGSGNALPFMWPRIQILAANLLDSHETICNCDGCKIARDVVS